MMSESEIDDMKKELIILRMHNKRLQEDIKKMQEMIKDLIILKIDEKISEEINQDEQIESSQNPVGNCT
jgi:hypothetical protein